MQRTLLEGTDFFPRERSLFQYKIRRYREYEEYGVQRVLLSRGTNLSRGTVIISNTEHGEYGVRTVRYYRSTNFSTEYGHYFLHQARGVRSTKSTVLLGYEF